MRLKLDIPKRLNCHAMEIRNKVLKTVVSKSDLALSTRWSVSKRFLTLLSYQTRLNNRCNINGKSRAVFRCLRLNRLVIASYQARGFIKGAYKASW
jgi:small subunit ribosomal protein S14